VTDGISAQRGACKQDYKFLPRVDE